MVEPPPRPHKIGVSDFKPDNQIVTTVTHSYCQAVILSGCHTVRLCDFPTSRLSDCPTASVSDWLTWGSPSNLHQC